MFKSNDIVKFDTGTEYIVSSTRTDRGNGMIAVSSWKNGKPFGAYRVINGERCTLIGHATRPATNADAWVFTPATTEPTAYETAVKSLAVTARDAIMAGLNPHAAVATTCKAAMQTGDDARNRTGAYKGETTTEQIEAAKFYAMVAEEALLGNVDRPSVGNVRHAVFAAL